MMHGIRISRKRYIPFLICKAGQPSASKDEKNRDFVYPSLKYRTDIEEGIGLSLNADAHTGSTGEEEKRAGNIRMLQQLALSQ